MANEREAKAMEAATDALSGRLAELKSSAGIQSLYFFREGVSRGGRRRRGKRIPFLKR